MGGILPARVRATRCEALDKGTMICFALLLLLAGTASTAENARPFFQGKDPESSSSAKAERLFSETFRVVDPDGDRIEVTAEGLPAGAKLLVRDPRPWTGDGERAATGTRAAFREVVLYWTPTRAQRGNHVVALVASNGKATERIEIVLKVEEEWESWFLPGVQYVGYFPTKSGEVGNFNGAAFELVIGSWVHQTEARGPSHGRVYVDLALLASDRAGADRAFAYTLGLDLSIERNPWRRYLIPIFGLEIGGFHQREAGAFFTTTPFVGAHLFSTRNVFVTATGGYVFPGRDIERFGGWRVRAGVNAVLW
jgi:hypothetical protein